MSSLKNPAWPAQEDQRNVIDYYKYWKHDAILADQDNNRCKLTIVAENFANDFNISTVVRSSNAFLCKEVIIVGRRRWDRRGACGMQNYEHIKHAKNIEDVITEHPKHRIVVLDNVPGASSIYDYKWHEDTILILGQESIGVSPESMAAAHDVVYIPQWGSVRSLNVGSAATVAMAFYRGVWGSSTNSIPI